jgi:hypothetical protein
VSFGFYGAIYGVRMLLIKRKKSLLTIGEVFFPDQSENVKINNCDILIVTQKAIETEGSKKYNTLHIDLTKNEDILKSELKKNTRNEISRCEKKDDLKVSITDRPTSSQLSNFIKFYNIFSKFRKLPDANKDKLISLQNKNGLALGMMENAVGDVLVMHAYIISNKRARLLYSASLHVNICDKQKKSLIGRSNRRLHWEEMIFYKRKMFDIYDFGGLSLSDSKTLYQIDKFKLGFGGEIVTEYNEKIGVSMMGKIILLMYKALKN